MVKFPADRIYTRQFWLLCISSFLFFASFNMIIPELPSYLASLGGQEYLGLYISFFTIAALISRPFSGKLADKVGRIPIMIAGAVVCFCLGLIYPMVGTVFGFLTLRFFHGFSTGFKPTGTAAYAADIVPVHKRGEAMGIVGLSGNVGMASGPTLGSAIAKYFSIEMMFYTSSLIAIFSVLILVGMKETLEHKEKFKWSMLKIKSNEIIEPGVLTPSIIMVLTAFSFGMILTIIPDYSDHLGVENRGYFLTAATVASLSVRIFAGRASDRFGRGAIVRISTLFIATSMLILAFSDGVSGFYIAAVVFGLGNGMNSPTLFAWAVDLSNPQRRGKGMATIFIGLELGITIGALMAGWLYASVAANFTHTFLAGAAFAFAAFIFLAIRKRLFGMA